MREMISDRNRILKSSFLLILGLYFLLGLPCRVQASVWDDAVSFYEHYGNRSVQFYNGAFYYASRGASGDVNGIRYAVAGQCFSLKCSSGVYTVTVALKGSHTAGSCKRISYKTEGGYRYSLYRIRYNVIYNRFQKKYPNMDFSALLYNKKLRMNIDFCLCLSLDGEDQGRITELENGGFQTTGKIYTTLEEILHAADWSESAQEALKGYFGISLDLFQSSVYYVRFMKNLKSASGSMKRQKFIYGEAQRLSDVAFTAPVRVTFSSGSLSGKASEEKEKLYRCEFQGWSTTSKGDIVFRNREKVNRLTDVQGKVLKLYAKWKKAEIILPSYSESGLSSSYMEDFRFLGWSLVKYELQPAGTSVKDLKNVYKAGTRVLRNKDCTFYAVWAKVRKKVVFKTPETGKSAQWSFSYNTDEAGQIRSQIRRYLLGTFDLLHHFTLKTG